MSTPRRTHTPERHAAVAKNDAVEKEPGRLATLRQSFTMIRRLDPMVVWWMLLGFVVGFGVVWALGWWLGHPWLALLSAVPAGFLGAAFMLNRRGNTAMYGALDGQPGAVGAALQGMGKRGWYADTTPVAMDAARGTKVSDLSGAAMVFRALGRPGVVLLGEGPRSRAEALLRAEAKKVGRVAPGVPVETFYVGDGEGDLPLAKVSSRLTRMKPVLTKEETSLVNKRLKAITGLKPPVPAGMDPSRARVDRKAMRGR